MTAGEKLYRLRARERLSLQQAASRLGIHKSTLCRYELDEFPRGSDRVREKMCELYRTEPECLTDESGPEQEEAAWSEEQLFDAYRKLSERGRLRVQHILRSGGGGS